MSVTLRTYVDADVELCLALETDPVAMAELGGPREREAVLRVHVIRAAAARYLVIESDGEAVGTIGSWDSDHDGAPIHEAGWMVLPHAHGRGIATAALGQLLDLVRADPAVTSLHAFPGASNVPSNRLCDRFGFADLGPVEVDFGPHLLPSRHRVLELTDERGGRPG